MKLNYIVAIAILTSLVSAKNVVNLQGFKDNLDKEAEGVNKRQDINGEPVELNKRKNIVDLQGLKDKLNNHEKREPKYRVDLNSFKIALEDESSPDLQKRKNVVNLNDFNKEQPPTLKKRKNIVNLNDFKVNLEDEAVSNKKRDAKNVFDITKLKVDSQPITKRDQQQQILQDKHVLFSINSIDCYNNLLQSILPQMRSISIFAGYIRDNELINSKTELANETMVIIAPTNYAIENKLGGLKPWEFPHSVDNIKDELEQDKILQQNLNEYLNGHIITNFESKLIVGRDEEKNPHKIIIVPLNNGKLVRIRQDQITDEFKIRVEGRDEWIKVDVVKQVENGFVFVINDSLVKP
ncbi:uncharacterized protein J8A68_005203 [[Candida] subhashii]|uniref:FAS1 domain-containing protein n=1 Tax=[Candida] subhashii TaxID=561895 RepID=A0A8J5Q763_9ASCO|nr:uncharacterized protein J8A68_005203 [[Candida] subhashii]KAG7661311.1 hypothetical protein J8A68_005203 [[Candida] subhashii]